MYAIFLESRDWAGEMTLYDIQFQFYKNIKVKKSFPLSLKVTKFKKFAREEILKVFKLKSHN